MCLEYRWCRIIGTYKLFLEVAMLFPQVCREYKRGTCQREECRYAHPPDNVSIDYDNQVTMCIDFVKGNCSRPTCRYYHPPTHNRQVLDTAIHLYSCRVRLTDGFFDCWKLTAILECWYYRYWQIVLFCLPDRQEQQLVESVHTAKQRTRWSLILLWPFFGNWNMARVKRYWPLIWRPIKKLTDNIIWPPFKTVSYCYR